MLIFDLICESHNRLCHQFSNRFFMRYFRYAVFTILALAFNVNTGSSQKVEEDLKNINLAYKNNLKLTMEIEYKVFKNHFADTPLQTEKGKVVKDGNLLFYNIGSFENIKTNDYTMYIDHEDKIISIFPRSQINAENLSFSRNDILSIDFIGILKLCKKVNYFPVGNASGSYELELSEGAEYSKFILTFNKNSFFIEKMTMFFAQAQNLDEMVVDRGQTKEKPRLEIVYSKISTKPSINKDLFSYEKYLEKRNGSLYSKVAYRDYEVINNLENN